MANNKYTRQAFETTDIFKIIAVGDCNTSGSETLNSGDNIPDKLAEMIRKRGADVAVLNLGYTMSTSREGLARMLREGVPADLLLLNFGLVDSWVTVLPHIYVPYYPDNFLRKVARKLLKAVKKRLRGRLARKFLFSGEVVPVEEYDSNIKKIIYTALNLNPKLIIVLWGSMLTKNDPQRNEKIKIRNDHLCMLAKSFNGIYIDTEKELKKIKDAIYIDNVHLSPIAAERVARTIFNRIISYL